MSIIRMRCLFFVAASVAFSATARGQGQDPFAEQDPFSKKDRRQQVARPINLTFQVTDQDGSPVPEARIRGPGIFTALYTQQQGTAVWEADENRLRQWAKRSQGKLRFDAIAPKDAVMPSVTKLVSISKLLESHSLKFQTQPGVRMIGRVIGQRDRKPVEGVSVVFRLQSGPRDTPDRHATTDADGQWSTVIPRVESKVSVRGRIDGYKLQDGPDPESRYSRIVRIPNDVAEIRVADFEIEQIKPLRIHVVDPSGKAVPGAIVTAYRQHWLDSKIVVWDSISQSQETGPQGLCRLHLKESDWDVAMVSASAVVDTSHIEGRAIVPTTDTDAIRVVVQSPSKISGVLLQNGNPAANVKLVLYEAINQKGKWTTIGVRGDAATNDRGEYLFDAPVGRHYMVATKTRDQNGVQTILHRTTQLAPSTNYRVPNVDLSDLQ